MDRTWTTHRGHLNALASHWYGLAMNQAERSPDPAPAVPATVQDDESRLVAAVVRGERDALAVLYDRHAGRLTALATRILGDVAQAEDVVHDVFVEAWHHAHEFDAERGTARAWLTIRARSRALDRLGHRERGVRVASRVGAEAAAWTAADRDAEGRHDAQVLRSSILGLPGELADMIEGAYYHGMSATELADRFAIPVGTVKSRLARALAQLRQQLVSPTATGGQG